MYLSSVYMYCFSLDKEKMFAWIWFCLELISGVIYGLVNFVMINLYNTAQLSQTITCTILNYRIYKNMIVWTRIWEELICRNPRVLDIFHSEQGPKSVIKQGGLIIFYILAMVVEVFGGVKSNSLAVITDAAHLLSDVGGFSFYCMDFKFGGNITVQYSSRGFWCTTIS